MPKSTKPSSERGAQSDVAVANEQPHIFQTASPNQIREEFQALVIRDILGPRSGDEESFTGKQRVRDRYLIGILAPKGVVPIDPARSDETRDDGSATGGTEIDPEDGQANRGLSLTPSSLGASFMVAADVSGVEVTVRWGQYDKVDSDDDQGPIWKRRQIEICKSIRIDQQDQMAPTTLSSEFLGVELTTTSRLLKNARLVSIFLTNGQVENPQNKDEQWMFQVSMSVQAKDQSPIFISRLTALDEKKNHRSPYYDEHLEMQYREQVEFAKGYGTSVHVTKDPNSNRLAIRIETTAIPSHEVPIVEAPSASSFSDVPEIATLLSDVVIDMKVLKNLGGNELVTSLTPLVGAYGKWLMLQEERLESANDHLADFSQTARVAISHGKSAHSRIMAGIELLKSTDGVESDAAIAFRFANDAMYQQRLRGQLIARRAIDPNLKVDVTLDDLDRPENHSWRLFQLAFILINLPSLADVTHIERDDEEALADLLFFPTGGGKTEAYLGLAAFTLAIRRLQGFVFGYDGRRGGIAVLMRYTLRLLTAQQFERASLLIAACEVIRREKYKNDTRWGTEPFRLGLWVGSAVSPNSTKRAHEEIEHSRTGGGNLGNAGALQLSRCPWCGSELKKGDDVFGDKVRGRTLVFCSDSFGMCNFTERNSPDEGIPVVTVDEELYRILPSFVISTVDKFAQLPLKGELHLLFGKTKRWCERHGYRSNDITSVAGSTESDSHRAIGKYPSAKTIDVPELRPPDLIIQDELHLITGPLGTMVALYEVAIDELSKYEIDGKKYRPKVIASTATIKHADQQVRAVFDRSLAVFPPPMIDSGDTFFAREVSTDEKPGRRFIGVCASGFRLKEAEVRLFSVLLSAGAAIWKKYGVLADPYMTMVGYFSALRELAGARRLIDDQVRTRAYRGELHGLGKRIFSPSNVGELTSRVRSPEILKYLSELNIKFDSEESSKRAISVLLATNMISVGVDVPRLGLMCVIGQPKETSEYIQATSRVGRSTEGPGLVFTLFNWSRPRDMSHFETFEYFHSTFYKQVEPLSVTPFSERALDRGLTAVVVGLTRHKFALDSANGNEGARTIRPNQPYVQQIQKVIAERASRITSSNPVVELVNASVQNRFDEWYDKQNDLETGSLGYREDTKSAITQLLENPEPGKWRTFTVQWSLRETEPEINLVLTDERYGKSAFAAFEMQSGTQDVVTASINEASDDSAIDEENKDQETDR